MNKFEVDDISTSILLGRGLNTNFITDDIRNRVLEITIKYRTNRKIVIYCFKRYYMRKF